MLRNTYAYDSLSAEKKLLMIQPLIRVSPGRVLPEALAYCVSFPLIIQTSSILSLLQDRQLSRAQIPNEITSCAAFRVRQSPQPCSLYILFLRRESIISRSGRVVLCTNFRCVEVFFNDVRRGSGAC